MKKQPTPTTTKLKETQAYFIYSNILPQFASSEVSLQLTRPSHCCWALIQVVPRAQWNCVELQRSMQKTSKSSTRCN